MRSLVSSEGRKGDRGAKRKVSRWFRAKGNPQERGWDRGGETVFCASGIPGGGAVRRETLSKFQTRFTTGKKFFSPSL